MAEYTKVHAAWADYPDVSTPVTASALDTIEAGIANAVPKDAVTIAGNRIVSSKLLAADTYAAWHVTGDGILRWGAGGASDLDTNLYRLSANVLCSDDTIFSKQGNGGAGFQYNPATDTGYSMVNQVGSETYARFFIRANGQMEWGSGGATATDTNLYRSAANLLRTDDALSVAGNIYADASIVWSSDTNLYRSAANVLATDDNFLMANSGQLRVTNYIAAAVGGAQSNKWPIYDGSGTLIGYIPIYAS